MNYYRARQRQSTGRWDYSCGNDGRVWPVGYCTGWPGDKTPTFTSYYTKEMWDEYIKEIEPFRDHFHSDGHATAEEACECYKKYLLDNRLKLFKPDNPSSMHKCKVCEEFTAGVAEIDYSIYFLCDAHRNREEVEKIFKVGEIWSSY